jgi:hypothetical protein
MITPQQANHPNKGVSLNRLEKIIGTVATVVLIGGIALTADPAVGLAVSHIRSAVTGGDSGVQECKNLRDNPDEGKFSTTQLNSMRIGYGKSSYSDIKNAGTNLVDVALVAKAEGPTLNSVGDLIEAYVPLTEACAAHGVKVQ